MLLAVDTSTRMVGLALYDGVQVIGEMTWRTQNYHTVELAPALHDLLERCAVQSSSLKALGVALGPGSFTGLRIGLALAKGISLGLNIPLVGVPTLDFLAAAQPIMNLPLIAVLQAGRGRLAVGWYEAVNNAWHAKGTVRWMTAHDLSRTILHPTLICGELGADDRQILGRKYKNAMLASPALATRYPAYLAEIAWRRWRSGQVDDVASITPIYLPIGEEIKE